MKRCKIGDLCLHIGTVNAGKLFEVIGEPSPNHTNIMPDGSHWIPDDPLDTWVVRVVSGKAKAQYGSYEQGLCKDRVLLPLNRNPDQSLEQDIAKPVEVGG